MAPSNMIRSSRDRWTRRQVLIGLGATGGAALGGGVLAGCSPNDDPGSGPKQVVGLQAIQSLLFLPSFVADDQGYFEEVGLEVAYTVVEGAPAAVQGLQSGGGLFAEVGPPLIVAANQEGGDASKIIAPVAFGLPLWVVGRDDIAPEDINAWKGKRIAVSPAPSVAHSTLAWLLLSSGWTAQDENTYLPPDGGEAVEFRAVSIGGAAAALEAGEAEMAYNNEPGASIMASQPGFHLIYDMFTHMGPYLFATWNTLQSTIDDDPETVQAFVTAIVKAHRFINDSPDDAVALGVELFGGDAPEITEAATRKLIEGGLWPREAMVPQADFDKTFNDVLPAANFPLDYPIAYDDVVDMSFVEQANNDLG